MSPITYLILWVRRAYLRWRIRGGIADIRYYDAINLALPCVQERVQKQVDEWNAELCGLQPPRRGAGHWGGA